MKTITLILLCLSANCYTQNVNVFTDTTINDCICFGGVGDTMFSYCDTYILQDYTKIDRYFLYCKSDYSNFFIDGDTVLIIKDLLIKYSKSNDELIKQQEKYYKLLKGAVNFINTLPNYLVESKTNKNWKKFWDILKDECHLEKK